MRTLLLLVGVGMVAGLAQRCVSGIRKRIWQSALIAIALLLLAACAKPFAYNGHAGFAYWDCEYEAPIAFVRLDYLTNESVICHEQAHLRQMAEVGCPEWHERMQYEAFRDSIEADAWRQAWEGPCP